MTSVRLPNELMAVEDSDSSHDSVASQEDSLAPTSPKTWPSNRPDLNHQDFLDFNRPEIDKHRQTLEFKRLYQGNGDELTNRSIVEEDKDNEFIAETYMSELISVRIRGQWLACKISWTRNDYNRQIYRKEVQTLQALRKDPHWHVVLLQCHYFNPSNEGRLLLSPLAESNLKDYLSQSPTIGTKRTVGKWMGCLAVGLENIHSNSITHKDIKVENILIHGDNVLITDMGISHKHTKDSKSSGVSPGSNMYMAPEAQEKRSRGRSQDIWSLLCCFIEMAAFIEGSTIHEFRQRLDLINFNRDYTKLIEWLTFSRDTTEPADQRLVLDLLLNSFKKRPKDRPLALTLVSHLRAIGSENPYIGDCCAIPRPASTIAETEIPPRTPPITLNTNPQNLNWRSVLHFVVTAGNHITGDLEFPAVSASLNELLQEVKNGRVRSVRSAEKSFLWVIAPRKCQSGEQYLSLCNAFIEELEDAVERNEDFSDAFAAYGQCLYNAELGEEERLYTTAYFAILVDRVLSHCRSTQPEHAPIMQQVSPPPRSGRQPLPRR